MNRLTASACAVAATFFLTGCGTTDDVATEATADPSADCFIVTDISGIRADETNRVDLATLKQADREAGVKDGSDERSFVARVGAAELGAAGMNTGLIPTDHPVLLFVNHGAWGRDDFVYSRGLDAEIGATERVFPFTTIAWALSVIDPETHQGIQELTSPDDACFRA